MASNLNATACTIAAKSREIENDLTHLKRHFGNADVWQMLTTEYTELIALCDQLKRDAARELAIIGAMAPS